MAIRIVPQPAPKEHPVCIQYQRTPEDKWRVIIHHLQATPIISTALLDTLPFPLPRCPFPQVKPKVRVPSAYVPAPTTTPILSSEEAQTEELITRVLTYKGHPATDIAHTLRMRREAIRELREEAEEAGAEE